MSHTNARIAPQATQPQVIVPAPPNHTAVIQSSILVELNKTLMANASEVQGEDSNVEPRREGCLVRDPENKVDFAEFVNGVHKGFVEITLGEQPTATFPNQPVVGGSLSAEETNVVRASVDPAKN